MKALAALILKKIGAAATGPLGWVLSLLIDKILKFLWEKGKEGLTRIWQTISLKWFGKSQDKKSEKYEETLQDGVTEQEQIDATTDMLNGRVRNQGPKTP